MAEFTPSTPGGGGHPARGGGLKVNKKNILLYGGIGVGVFVFISALMKGSPSQEAGGTVIDGNMPSNSADVQAQMQNFQSIMEGQLQTGLNQFANEMYSDNLAAQNDLKFLVEETKKDYERQMEELKKSQSPINSSGGASEPSPAPSIAYTTGFGMGAPGTGDGKATLGMGAVKSGDKSTVQAEIDRARSVILYRKEKGMDTTAQEAYLKNMQTGLSKMK